MARVQTRAQRLRPRRRRRVLQPPVRNGAGEGAARLRELRDRGAAVEAGADRGPRRTGLAQSPRRRGRDGGSRRRRPAAARGEGMATATENEVSCCYALQDKVWVDGPDAEPWEIYTVLADAEMEPGELRPASDDALCCGDAAESAARAADTGGPRPRTASQRRSSRYRAARRDRRRIRDPSATTLARRVGLQLLENSLATGAGLVALILAIGPISGAHFNPVVTLADRILGGTTNADALAYVVAQIDRRVRRRDRRELMFDLPAIDVSTHARSSGADVVRRNGRDVRPPRRDPRCGALAAARAVARTPSAVTSRLRTGSRRRRASPIRR